MIAVFDKAKEQVMKAESQSLQHMIIKEARSELFDAYDATVKNSCAGEDRSKDKKAIVKEAWKVLTDFLFRVDRLDFHNGCYTNDIGAFPSIIYE